MELFGEKHPRAPRLKFNRKCLGISQTIFKNKVQAKESERFKNWNTAILSKPDTRHLQKLPKAFTRGYAQSY